jgi:hypothetical protein
VSVAGLAAQTTVELAPAEIVGVGDTSCDIVLVPIQPKELVPLTVYVVVVKGLTETTDPERFIGNHV